MNLVLYLNVDGLTQAAADEKVKDAEDRLKKTFKTATAIVFPVSGFQPTSLVTLPR